MATKAPTKSKKADGRLAGKKFAFVGDLGYYQHESMFTAAVKEAGGTVVDADSKVPDYLIVGKGRGGKTPGQATALLKKHPEIQSLDIPTFCNLVLPTREELAERIRSGRMGDSPPGSNHGTHWHALEAMQRLVNSTIDLSGESFRGADLYGAHFDAVNLDTADLRESKLEYAHLPILRGAKFDGAYMEKAYLSGAEGCSFRNAEMTEAWFYDVHRYNQICRYPDCDFTSAKIVKARGDRTNFAGSIFRNADLTEGAFEHTDFTGADLTGANISQIHFLKANLTEAKLAGVKGHRADLRETKLVNADLSEADLREAVLTGADLTGANIDGADFAGANLAGTKLDGVDTSTAKNLVIQQPRQAGPKMIELANVASQSASLETSVELDLGSDERAILFARGRTHSNQFYHSALSSFLAADAKWGQNERQDGASFEQGMLNAAARWSHGTIRLDTVTAKGSKCPLKGKALVELAAAAWSEACGVDAADVDKKAKADAAVRQSLQDAMLAELKGGVAGIKKWNARPKHERRKIAKIKSLDLSGCDLSGADFSDCDLSGANLQGANLKKAILRYGSLEKTNFAGADLQGAKLESGKASGASFENAQLKRCKLSGLTLRSANFRGVDLSKMVLEYVDLRGADLSTAQLDGTVFTSVTFDEKTRFPKGFVPPETMQWKGPGPHPGLVKKIPRAKKAGAMTFDGFLKALANKVHAAKMQKATSMLKAERFQLFAEVKDDSLVGIVKSQTSKDLIYSCRFGADGSFGCCTQNLKPCGGLQGSLCKHLFVLIIGLTKAEKLDPATVDNWINSSTSQKPAIDKDVMSETFIRYKGAEAGEVDWRPTETIPEDFYAM